MKETLKETLLHTGLLWFRALMGAGIAAHGAVKIFGGKMDAFSRGVAGMGFPLPEFFAWSAALSEFAGGIFIILGLYTRPAAFFVALTMAAAAFLKHAGDPFSDKELALAYGAAAVMFMIAGPGRFSVDSRSA